MKPDAIRVPWARVGCWVVCFAMLTGCTIGKPRFSASNSVSLTAASEIAPSVERAAKTIDAEGLTDPGMRGQARSRPRSVNRGVIQPIAWESPSENFLKTGALVESESWLEKPPRVVAAESQSPFDPDRNDAEVPFVEPSIEPASMDESFSEFETERLSLRDDACDLLPMLRDDVCSIFTWRNAIILGAGVGGALAIRESLDGDVRDYTLRHRQLWGEGSQVMRQFGEFAWQVPFIAGIYGWGLWTQDERTHEFSKALISAYAITSITTVSIKGVTNTERPTTQFQDGHYGFPSFHTASTFSMAAVIDEYYGWPAGVPAYIMAGLVGWSRIDQREHDLSDVVFGSILGFVIGKSIAAAHLERSGNQDLVPYYDPATNTFGALFTWRF